MATGLPECSCRWGLETSMHQMTLPFRHAPHSDWLLRWQATVIVAFAGGSLIAALCNISALMTLSIARSALSQVAAARCWSEHHG